jgi:SRSO17 transposase
MNLKQIASLGRRLVNFLGRFADCFGRREPRELLQVYVQGQLSDVPRKNAEAIALEFHKPPRTLQRFLESIKWDEEKLLDRCQQIIAQEHAHPQAIGVVDESGIPKSGQQTAGAQRQWCGNQGKVDNCVVGVHLSFAAPGFQCLLDSRLYLPEDWANDPQRRKQCHIPEEVEFLTKPQIALELIDRALANGVQVAAWTFDELYGRDGKFLDGLAQRQQAFVGEVPVNFHGWVHEPKVLADRPKKPSGKGGPSRKRRRTTKRRPSCEVGNLGRYSDAFLQQKWQRYRIKDTDKGPQVWEVKWSRFWRKGEDGLPVDGHCLIVARNVQSGEIKYFVANRVPGENGVTLTWLLRVAFGRCSVEQCFRTAKEELGMDHFEVRGWRCIHRHYYLTQLSYLFCARVRQEMDPTSAGGPSRLTVEQVRAAMNLWLSAASLPRSRREVYERALRKQHYYQRRNEQARVSHTKTRRRQLLALGIDVDCLPSCFPDTTSPPI